MDSGDELSAHQREPGRRRRNQRGTGAAVLLAAAVCIAATSLSACGQSNGQAQPSGAQLYANNCASCHGAQGEGDGPVAAVMKVAVPNLRNLNLRNNGEFPADAVRAYVDGRNLPTAHGDRYMPIWGNEFGYGEKSGEAAENVIAQRIDAIVEYVRTLQYR
jgi:mono/diheme cytochrome c family protein